MNYPKAYQDFDAALRTRVSAAPLWTAQTRGLVRDWQGSRIGQVTRNPSDRVSERGFRPHQPEFWHVNVANKATRWIWRFLRDALSHWNVANTNDAKVRVDAEIDRRGKLLPGSHQTHEVDAELTREPANMTLRIRRATPVGQRHIWLCDRLTRLATRQGLGTE